MRVLHEAYWKFFKKNMLRIQRAVRSQSIDKIRKVQWDRLKALLEYAYSNNDFYTQFFESSNLTPADIKRPQDMLKLPITDKQVFKAHFDKVITKGITDDMYSVTYTSGSTGEPFKFYTDLKTQGPNAFVGYLLNKEAMGIKPFQKINELVIKAKPPNEIKDLNQKFWTEKTKKFRDIWHPRTIGLNAHAIKPENILDIADILRTNKIKAINGYSSAVLSLAGLLKKNKISIPMVYVITIGEGCLAQQRKFISDVFNCPVYHDYTSSECLYMGSECRFQNGYHMDHYNHYFEFINGDRYAKNNEVGEIIVTNLNNFVFPFIRYKVGDKALVTDQSCNCGNNFPIVKEIFGRSSDAIITPTGKRMPGILFAGPFKPMHAYINQYQIIQVDDDNVMVNIVPNGRMKDDILDKIKIKVDDLLDNSMQVSVQLTEEISAMKSGKKKILITKSDYALLEMPPVSEIRNTA